MEGNPFGRFQPSHSDYITYFFIADKEKFTYPDGRTVEGEGQAGQVIWDKAETHAAENIGTSETHALLIELKGPAKK